MPSRGDLQRLLLGALALVLTTAALVSSPSVAEAAVSAPSGLSPDSTSQAGVPTLEWNDVRSATKYNVQVSTSLDFGSPVESTSTYNRRYVPKVALPPSTVYWRVQTVSSTGTVSTWSTASFERDPLAAPSPQAPADGVVLEQPADPPVLTWSPVANAVAYEVMYDNDSDFVSPTTSTTGTTSYLVPDPQPVGQFWWKVRAVFGSGINTDWSESRTYRVDGLHEVVPSLPNEQEKIEDVIFDWPAVAGAKDYELRISTDQDFNTLVPTAGRTILVKSTRYSPPKSLNNDEYWWQVRARDNNGNAIAWEALDDAGEPRVPTRHFQRHWPEVPSLLFPADSTTDTVANPFFFQWSPVPHASNYELQMGSDRAFSPGTYSTCFTRATTYTPGFDGPGSDNDYCSPVPGNTYYWRVRALDDPADIIGEWSVIRAFVYDPGMVQEVAPADGATVTVPTLSWRPLQGAERYHVALYSSASGTPVDQATTYSTSWTPTPNVPLDPAKSPYRWSVTGIDHNGAETMAPIPSTQNRFTLASGDAPSTAAPLTPVDVTTESTDFPTLTWQPKAGADYYKVLVSPRGAPGMTYLKSGTSTSAPDEEFRYPAATDITTRWLSPGDYDFAVEAYDKNDAPLGLSATRGQFTIADLTPVTGHKVALTGTALADNACTVRLDAATGPKQCDDLRQTPVLDWAPVQGAGLYMVYLFKDDRLTNSVYPRSTQQLYHLVTTQNTRWTPLDLLPDNQAGDGYYWFVRPCKASNVCAPDPTAATNSFDKSSLAIDVSDPRNVSSAVNEIELYWRDNLDNNQDPANSQLLSTGAAATNATVEAQQYRVQISDDRTFAKVLHEEEVDQTTFTPYSRTFPEGPLYWRVQAVDGSGNSLTWSETQTIDKHSPAVNQLSPVSSTAVSGTPYFTWEPQKFAGAYKLEVYKNGDTTTSSVNRVINATTLKQAAYTHDKPLPVSDLPYLWRVQRLDADNRPNSWSPLRPFMVTGQAPGLDFPANSAYVRGDDSLFSWTAVSDAASYKFERRTDGATYSSETVTTRALSWAPTSLLRDGRYQWRVSSMDSAGKTIASSPWRDFVVDGTSPEVTRKLPGSRTRRDSNWVVTFSEPVRRVNSTTMRLYRANRRDPVAARITGSNGGRTWTLNPSSLMARGVRYTLKLSVGITDRAGNAAPATGYSRTPR